MGRQLIKYGTALSALVILSGNASGFGKLFTAGAQGGATLLKSVQGRD